LSFLQRGTDSQFGGDGSSKNPGKEPVRAEEEIRSEGGYLKEAEEAREGGTEQRTDGPDGEEERILTRALCADAGKTGGEDGAAGASPEEDGELTQTNPGLASR